MLKQIITACAGLAISSGLAFGLDVSGVYSGQGNGQPVSVTLSSQDGVVRGQVAVGGGTLPLAGRESNGQIQGIWRNADGQDVPFAAVAGPNGLQLQTNGVVYSLARGGASVDQRAGGQLAPVPVQADPVVGGNVPAAAPVAQVQLQTRQGRVMQADIPAGWQFSDTSNGIDTASPDGVTWVSHIWIRGIGPCTPDAFLQTNMRAWGQWGIANVQLTGSKELNNGSKLYEFNYTKGGHAEHAMVQVAITPGMAEMVSIQTAPENFQQALPSLIRIAGSVRVLDNNAFCDNGKINNEIQKRINIQTQTAQDIANIQNSGYWERSRIQDQMSLQRSDTNRDQNRFDNGNGQVTAPLEAQRVFKHADGTFSYSTNNYDPVPSDATELNPHQYR